MKVASRDCPAPATNSAPPRNSATTPRTNESRQPGPRCYRAGRRSNRTFLVVALGRARLRAITSRAALGERRPHWGWSACSSASVASTPSLSVAPLKTPPKAARNDCAHVAAFSAFACAAAACAWTSWAVPWASLPPARLDQLLGGLLHRQTRVLLRGPELSGQVVIARLGRRDGLLGLVDLFLLCGDLGVGVIEIRIQVDGVDPERDDAGGQEAGDGDKPTGACEAWDARARRMSAVGWMARRRPAGRRTLPDGSARARPGRADRSLTGSLAGIRVPPSRLPWSEGRVV